MYRLNFLIVGLLLRISGFAQSPEQNLAKLGIELPPVAAPIANYVNVVRTGNLLFLAGKGPSQKDGTYISGKIPTDLSIEKGYEAAKLAALAHIAVLKKELGDLSKVKRIVKVLGMVNCSNDFTDQPKVINGYSDCMVAVFGEKGKHARSAVGTNALPMNIAVEVEVIVEIEN
jgi:enamine deaminase RidA (YjgF/YER057c/UK114 family)